MASEQALKAIGRMMNAFPQTVGNYLVLLDTYDQELGDVSTEAVEMACRRFMRGEVPDQGLQFAPSVPTFLQEVRRCEEVLAIQARPRLPAPKYIPGPLAPFQIKTEQARQANAHLPILFENITFDEWRKMSGTRQVPVGAKWVAALGIVYGPAPKKQTKAA